MKKIYIDFDGVIVNTIRKIVDLYNEDFVAYKKYEPVNWVDINTWDFKELQAATREQINHYFNQPRFFMNLEIMPLAINIIDSLSINNDVIIVSSGYSPNLILKEKWCKEHFLQSVKFRGVNLKEHSDKSHIDMSNGIFIDDSMNNLTTSNADIKICFGDIYEWNKDWNGVRCFNWTDVQDYLKLKGEIIR